MRPIANKPGLGIPTNAENASNSDQAWPRDIQKQKMRQITRKPGFRTPGNV